jgi:hypothetical protein
MNKTSLTLNTNAYRNSFLHQCLNNWFAYSEDQRELLNNLASQAANSEDFINSVLDCKDLNQTQLYAELAKDSGRFTEVLLRDYEWSNGFTDDGSVIVGVNGFYVSISTGAGDGDLCVLSCKKGEFNTELLNFETSVSGEAFEVEFLGTLSGRFGVFSGNGFVVFEQWD